MENEVFSESLNYRLWKVTKTRPIFWMNESIYKIVYLAIGNAVEMEDTD
ncbi:MAG: hypothetical protein LBB43_00600 [Spirochaetaceae bacterium]|nr:hypothetical protein [Spirochaetaceae bacterium]